MTGIVIWNVFESVKMVGFVMNPWLHITHLLKYDLTFSFLIKLRKEFETMPKAYMAGIIPKFLGVKADITPHYNNDYWLTSQEVSLPINLGLIKVGNDAERGDVVQHTVVM